MRERKTDPEYPLVLPFVPGQASNGEFIPRERSRHHLRSEALAFEMAERIAGKQGVDRRRFLQSMGGLAVTLAAINIVGCSDDNGDAVRPGATFAVPTDADPTAVSEMLEGDEFIFDVQTHHVDPEGPWVHESPATAGFFRAFRPACTEGDNLECLSRFYYAHDIFLESDTTIAVLSDIPSASDSRDPLDFEQMKMTRDIMNDLSPPNSDRLRLHSVVVPNVGEIDFHLERMRARAEDLDVSAWKVYTPYGPGGVGWYLDDPDTGLPMIETARETGVKMICAHKGLPLFGFDRAAASPRDIGVVARMYPDMKFIVYHSGWFPRVDEGPYDPEDAELGTNTLVKSLLDNGIEPNTNVYAELGTTWRNVMSDPTQAAHLLGKLIKYCGEDNVLWGTDCIWTGSPQPQIVAFRTFQMDPEFADEHGYAPLTDEVKRKILGLNAARIYGVDPAAQTWGVDRDEVERLRMAWREFDGASHEPRWVARNPISRRGVLEWFAGHGGRWQLGT
jgi:uncharacterized protein